MEKRDLRPLSGVLFVVIVLIAFFGLSGDTPDGDASAAKATAFYHAHETRQILAAIALSLAAVVLVFFSAVLKERLDASTSGRSVLPLFTFGAGVVAAGGFLAAAAIHFALADYAGDISPVATQAINSLDGDFFLPFAIGIVALVLGASLTAIRTKYVPVWLGWIGVVLFLISFTPAGFVGFGLSAIWIVAVSILLYLHDTSPSVTTTP